MYICRSIKSWIFNKALLKGTIYYVIFYKHTYNIEWYPIKVHVIRVLHAWLKVKYICMQIYIQIYLFITIYNPFIRLYRRFNSLELVLSRVINLPHGTVKIWQSDEQIPNNSKDVKSLILVYWKLEYYLKYNTHNSSLTNTCLYG